MGQMICNQLSELAECSSYSSDGIFDWVVCVCVILSTRGVADTGHSDNSVSYTLLETAESINQFTHLYLTASIDCAILFIFLFQHFGSTQNP